MIVLDTNVLSALMRAEPDAAVINWLDRQPADSVWLSSNTVFETRFGLALLSKGRRRVALHQAFERALAEDLANRVLDFDSMAAATAAHLAADRQRAGRSLDLRDTIDRRHRPGPAGHDRHEEHQALRRTRRPHRKSVGLTD